MSDHNISDRGTPETTTSDRERVDDTTPIGRRNFLLGAGTAVAAGLAPTAAAQAQQPQAGSAAAAAAPNPNDDALLTLTPSEAAFFSAVADTMIPADALTPSGSACGVTIFIDRQLAGAWGGGARMYRVGPVPEGQTGAGLSTAADAARVFRRRHHRHQRVVAQNLRQGLRPLGAEGARTALKELESGKAALGEFDGKQFFEALLKITMEGFFADPIYGGNRDKAGWRMVGYPGLPAVYSTLIDEYRNKRYRVDPQSIADFS